MRIFKFLCILMAATVFTLPAMGARIPPGCTGNGLVVTISRPEPLVYPASTVEYTITLENQAFPQCQKTNVYLYFYPPDVSPPVDCRVPTGDAVLIAGPLTLDPGTLLSYDSGDNSELAFTAPSSGDFTAYVCAFGDAQTLPTGTDNADADNDITTTVINPVISITKSAEPTAICEGAVDVPVTYTYLVSWGIGGDIDMTDVVVTDDKCGPVVRGTDNPGNNDAWLESGEVWVFTCSTTVSGETTNTATVNANDILGNPVTPAQDDYTITVNPAPVVSVDPSEETICEVGTPAHFCAVVEPLTGTPPFTYEWRKTPSSTIIATTECIDVSEAGEYCVTVIDDVGCQDTACATLTVIPQPDCSINSGPRTLCEDEIGIPVEYCSEAVADAYQWVIISGPGEIVDGIDDQPCVLVNPTGLGDIVLELQIWNDVPGDGACGDSCQITITVEECVGTFCTFTQGFWGNAGGKACGGQTTSELIAAALAANGGSITVGIPPRSITFNSVQCILDSLPAGGTPAVLPIGPWDCSNLSSFYKNKKKTEINNVLVGQAVALTLNLLVSEGCVEDSGILADWVLPEDFCTVPYGNEEACAEYSSIPSSLVGKTVAELLDAVNAALGGTGSISDAYNGATSINEGFDECRTVVPCIRPEICGNGCDDDGDGLVDGDDIVDCPPIILP